MQQRSEETHSNILSSAYQLFSRNGYDVTSVANICQSAGVSKGAFYHHFPTKQAVFLELLEKWLEGLDTGFQIVRQGTQDVPQAIMQMATMAGNVVQDIDMRLLIILEFWTQASRDPSIWKTTIAPYRRYQEYFRALIQTGIDEGSFRKDLDPYAAARTLVSMAVGLLMQAVFDPQSINWTEEVQNSIAFILDGFKNRA